MDNPTLKPLVHSPDSAAKRLNTNTRRIYTLIASGELRSYKDGKQRKIPDSECQGFVRRKMAAAA